MGSDLSEEARFVRISEILAKGITLHRGAHQKKEKTIPLITDEVESADPIIKFLSLHGEASPAELCEALSVSRTTMFRRLKELRVTGLVVSKGHTRKLKYSLS
ncbi:MAG: winged helix-turn-helix domain-containing protein [Bacteroidota bacterium]